jgi:predicted Fe-S protein YdhL (DUF1289 family)
MTSTAAKVLAARARQVRGGGEVISPCQSVCRMESGDGSCEGCLRTLDEIAAWSVMGDDAKRAVWRLIEQRLAARMAA